MAEKKAYPLRISSDVLDAVQRWADDELRSVNAQIEYVLRDALRKAGVDNLQAFETTLQLSPGEAVPQDLYVAVNIVGLVAAADLGRSAVSPGTPERLISTDFDSLAIDAGRAHGLLMFRLAENTSAVVVHRSVKDAVERAGIVTLTWLLPEEWAG